ncbi:hypothetical protein FOL47_010950 [Perkinsus chesapeaki]|uniref:Uncharacterized protein n=1 Tax=Perkinsus chesapeaki TaxID=330153 RepID=A0A7J6N1E5_PERCH|nr:hypothetical protein FOL47_010950 [Perkinsus chesapeaki]
MVCTFASTTTSHVLNKFCDVSSKLGPDGVSCCLKPLPEVGPTCGSTLLGMMQTEEGRAHLNKQQEPLLELLNRKAQSLGLGLKIASKGFEEPSFVTKERAATAAALACSVPEAEARKESVGLAEGEAAEAPVYTNGCCCCDEDLLDAAKIGEVTPTKNYATISIPYDDIISDTSSDEVVTEAEDEEISEPPHKKQKIQCGRQDEVEVTCGPSVDKKGVYFRRESSAGSGSVIFCNLNSAVEVGQSPITLLMESGEDAASVPAIAAVPAF